MKDEVGTLGVYVPISTQGLRLGSGLGEMAEGGQRLHDWRDTRPRWLSSHGVERRDGSESEFTTSAESLSTVLNVGGARETLVCPWKVPNFQKETVLKVFSF